MKWTILLIIILILLGLMMYPEQTKALLGMAIWGTKTLTGYAIKYGPTLLNESAAMIG